MWTGMPLVWVRVVLAFGSSAALVAAAAAWAPMVGTRVAAAAAVVSGGSWLVLFYGSEVMPNLWSAIALLGACGLAARGLARGDPRPGWGPLVLLVVAGLFRPIDASAAGLALIAVSTLRTRSWRWPAWITAAVGVGIAPWLVEMSVRFGGPLGALRDAAAVGRMGENGPLAGFRLHLALADGPLIGADARPVPWGAALWWITVLGLGILGAVRTAGDARPAAHLALAVGGALLVTYVALVGGEAPRYLLPAILLLAMAAAAGAVTLPSAAVVPLVIAAAVWVGWQVSVLREVDAGAVGQRANARAAGEFVRTLVDDGPCLVLATHDYPQIAYASGCTGRWLREGGPPVAITTGTAEPGFLVTSDDGSPPHDLEFVGASGGYEIYRLGPERSTP